MDALTVSNDSDALSKQVRKELENAIGGSSRDKQEDTKEPLVYSLNPIIPKGQTKNAVVDVISKLPDTVETAVLCNYILQIMLVPDVLCADIYYIRQQEAAARRIRSTKLKLKEKMLAVMGFIVTGLLSMLFSSLL